MNASIRRVVLAALVCGTALRAQQSQSAVRLYGFMDMLISTDFMDDNSLFQSLRVDDGMRVSFDHLNLYLDATPGENVRLLSELSFRPKPIQGGARLGADIALDMGGGAVLTMPVDAGDYPDLHRDDDPSRGEVFDWGSFSLERALCEYLFRDWLTIGFGKFITPAGIWNMDHGSPVLITVRQPYQTGLMEFFPRTQLGIMASGTLFAGDTDLGYSLYLSSGRNGFSIKELRDVAGGGHVSAALPLLDGLDIGLSGYTGMDNLAYKKRTVSPGYDSVLAWGVQAFLETGTLDPNDTAYQRVFTERVEYWSQHAGLDPEYHSYGIVYQYLARETSFGADLKLKWGEMELQSEFNYELLQNYLADAAETHQFGFYALLSYGIPLGSKLKLRPYGMFERIWARGSDENPQTYLAGENTGLEESIVDGFNTYIIGLNTKLASYITLKTEFCYIDIVMGGRARHLQDAMDVGFLNIQLAVAF